MPRPPAILPVAEVVQVAPAGATPAVCRADRELYVWAQGAQLTAQRDDEDVVTLGSGERPDLIFAEGAAHLLYLRDGNVYSRSFPLDGPLPIWGVPPPSLRAGSRVGLAAAASFSVSLVNEPIRLTEVLFERPGRFRTAAEHRVQQNASPVSRATRFDLGFDASARPQVAGHTPRPLAPQTLTETVQVSGGAFLDGATETNDA